VNERENKSESGSATAYATLRSPTLVGLIVANMIGAGVFTTSGFALADLGSANRVMLAWALGGIIALCGALSYGGLARRFTESGGEYLFLSRALHPLAGFIAGWVSLLAGFTGAIAFAALAFETYISPLLDFTLPPKSLAIALIVTAALLHGARVGAGVGVQNVVVFLKFALIIIFIAAAIYAAKIIGADSVVPPAPEFSLTAFAGSLVWISLSYSGFNAAVYVAGETRDAQNGCAASDVDRNAHCYNPLPSIKFNLCLFSALRSDSRTRGRGGKRRAINRRSIPGIVGSGDYRSVSFNLGFCNDYGRTARLRKNG
jgi:APA family basic amino acid/polyamine antiporter